MNTQKEKRERGESIEREKGKKGKIENRRGKERRGRRREKKRREEEEGGEVTRDSALRSDLLHICTDYEIIQWCGVVGMERSRASISTV